MSSSATTHTPTAMPIPAPPPDAESNSVPVALNKIVPSQTNPGRQFDPARDSDLVANIRAYGVLQPILLRPAGGKGNSFQLEGKLELVAGERRYHCAGKAGRSTIPAVIKQLTDVQALEIQTIENDQREDLDPRAKAAAYHRLWKAYEAEGVPVKERIERMSERLSRKPRTVWNILSSANLIERGNKMLQNGEISPSHVYEISRQPAAVQEELLEYVADEIQYGGSVSVRELKDYIKQNCNRFLDSAPFDKSDAKLVPAAGACGDCMKNTAVNPNLLDEESKPKKGKSAICTDKQCWKGKTDATLVQIEKTSARAGKELIKVSVESTAGKGVKLPGEWKQVKEQSCQYVASGLIVNGDAPGKQVPVCVMTNVCKTHWGSSAPERTERRAVSRPRSAEENKRMLLKQRGKRADQAYRGDAVKVFRQAVTQLKPEDLRDVALQMIQMTDRRHRNPIFAAMGWKTSKSDYGPAIPVKQIQALKPPDVAAFLALMTVASRILPGLQEYWPETHVALEPFAARHKVDLAKIEKRATAGLREHWRQIDARKKGKSAPVQTSARKKAAAA